MPVRQISIFLENRMGRLAGVLDALADRKINIRALSLADTSDFGILRLIVPDPATASQVLGEKGFTVAETEVLAVTVPDSPGGLSRIVRMLSDEGINLEYLYAFVEKRGGEAVVIIRVEEIEAAAGVMTRAGARILDEEELARL